MFVAYEWRWDDEAAASPVSSEPNEDKDESSQPVTDTTGPHVHKVTLKCIGAT